MSQQASGPRAKIIDLVGLRRWFFIASGGALLLSILLLAVFGLRPGIEFTSGTTMLIQFNRQVSQADLRATFADLGHPEARLQSTAANQYLIRTRQLEVPPGAFTDPSPAPSSEQAALGPVPLRDVGTVEVGADGVTGDVDFYTYDEAASCQLGEPGGTFTARQRVPVVDVVQCAGGPIYGVLVGGVLGYLPQVSTNAFQPTLEAPVTLDAGERTEIEQHLYDQYGVFEVLEFSSVSPVVSRVAVRNAAAAIVVASLFIMGYVAFAFSTVPRPFRYAVTAIAALIHDVVFVLGAFALFGVLFGIEINLMFVTGLLTVIGFSVHDTIVVFDRIRENIRQTPHAPLSENVNSALLQTFARSLNTSLTVLLTIGAMLALGGVTIREFLLVIVVGVTVGTYSSIGIAAQLLVAWEAGDFARLLRREAREPA